MHAMIRQGDGRYYISAVFGYYRDIDETETDDYKRYLQEIYKPYWIVWDEKKKRLIRWLNMAPNTEYLSLQILIVDADQSNWITDEQGVGCVDFLSRDLLDSFLDEEQQPEDILKKCHEMDTGYEYNDIQKIKTQKDIKNLEWASGGFHDARIAKKKLQDDDTLYLLFDGTWGCKIEVWFSGDLEYDISRRDPENDDPFCWHGSTIILQNGFVYFVDEKDMTVDKIEKGYCYFRARQMKYRIIPD